MIVLADTHVIVWYFRELEKLSPTARNALENAERIHISAITLIEMQYLVEKGKISEEALKRLFTAIEGDDAPTGVESVGLHIAKAMAQIPREAVPDMPDRIIAATALFLGCPLVTCDERIRNLRVIKTVW